MYPLGDDLILAIFNLCKGGVYIRTVNPDAKRAVSMLKALANDEYFNRVFLPLFNFDFRRVIIVLYDAILDILKTYTNVGSLSFGKTEDDLAETKRDLFGMRGALFHGIIHKLRQDNFLQYYPYNQENNGPPSEGYCMPMRMVLTLLLNNSKLIKSEDVFKHSKAFADVPLGEVIERARKVYDPQQIISCLVEAYSYHLKSWVHLVTFRNRPVMNLRSFGPELAKLQKGEPSPNSLYSVNLTLNPSGFIFLKHMIVHFEFYSVLSGNDQSLFTVGLTRAPMESENKFQFEVIVRKVLRLVSSHTKDMQTFYKSKFDSQLGISEIEYLTSDFVFKHFKYSSPSGKGLFHSTRIISDHLRYLDKFREWLLQRSQIVENIDRIEINKRILTLMKEYIALWDSSKHDKHDLPAIKQEMKRRIRMIQNQEYRDFYLTVCPPPSDPQFAYWDSE